MCWTHSYLRAFAYAFPCAWNTSYRYLHSSLPYPVSAQRSPSQVAPPGYSSKIAALSCISSSPYSFIQYVQPPVGTGRRGCSRQQAQLGQRFSSLSLGVCCLSQDGGHPRQVTTPFHVWDQAVSSSQAQKISDRPASSSDSSFPILYLCL